VQQAIQNRRGQDVIVEDLPPVREALVADDDQTATFIGVSMELPPSNPMGA
jgi:hypothetical protein